VQGIEASTFHLPFHVLCSSLSVSDEEVMTMTLLVMVVVFGFCFAVTRRMTLVPSKRQSVLELIIEGLSGFLREMIGPDGPRYLPLIAALFLFIVCSNLLGIVPGFISPTSNLNTTLALALVAFFSYHIMGLRTKGLRYFKDFLGPVWWLAPLMLPLEIISHLARILSLSFRLFGNIHGDEIVVAILVILAGLVHYIVPWQLFMFPLAVFTGVVQALIFTMLTTLYIGSAVTEEAH
jgi:F-type H+-transporting ATPase subunit a